MTNDQLKTDFVKQQKRLIVSYLIAAWVIVALASLVILIQLALAAYAVLSSPSPVIDSVLSLQIFVRAVSSFAGGGFSLASLPFFKGAAKGQDQMFDLLKWSSMRGTNSNDNRRC